VVSDTAAVYFIFQSPSVGWLEVYASREADKDSMVSIPTSGTSRFWPRYMLWTSLSVCLFVRHTVHDIEIDYAPDDNLTRGGNLLSS